VLADETGAMAQVYGGEGGEQRELLCVAIRPDGYIALLAPASSF